MVLKILMWFFLSFWISCYATNIPIYVKDGGSIPISLQNSTIENSSLITNEIYTLQQSSRVKLFFQNIPISVHFILVQAHAYLTNITLSYMMSLTPHLYVNGTNIGLVKVIDPPASNVEFYVWNPNPYNVSVLLAAQVYENGAPIPGGCNMEFSVEVAPYMHVKYDSNVVTVEAQSAASPSFQDTCETQNIQYSIYHMYLPERDFTPDTYFFTLRSLLTVDDVKVSGKKVSLAIEGPKLRRIYSAYSGTGSAYAMIATSGITASAYVPFITYACDPSSWSDSCEVLTSAFSKVLCAMMVFVGLFVSIFGHHFFKTTLFIMGFLAAGIVSYILIQHGVNFNDTVTLLLSVIAGFIFGLVWLFFWTCWGSPFFSILMALFVMGFVVASVIFYAGVADINLLVLDFNFWGVFSCLLLGQAFLLLIWSHQGNMLSCAVLGAYLFIVPIDHYIGSNLKYIIVNVIRRAVVPEFKLALVDPPFQEKDIIVTCVWIALSLAGYFIQKRMQRGKPPFPPPPSLIIRRGRCHRNVSEIRSNYSANERTPLLVQAHVPWAGPGDDNVFDSPGTDTRSCWDVFSKCSAPSAPPPEPEPQRT